MSSLLVHFGVASATQLILTCTKGVHTVLLFYNTSTNDSSFYSSMVIFHTTGRFSRGPLILDCICNMILSSIAATHEYATHWTENKLS